ncbi:MAG TPA: class I SAM-dependent methyltransferase [Clostridia bacterium]|nr:class I SAM-dependent methyltransferase [Clostridia bacterium]
MDRTDPAYRGQADYSPLLLRLYDPLVIGLASKHVWRSPPERLVELYRRNIRPDHLDVGPGTGYFLEHAGLPKGSRVTILDPNPNVLRHVSRRLRDLDVSAVRADVLKPLPVAGPFDSAALSLVLHCLPGPMPRKASAVVNVAEVLAPGGVLFGATVLGHGPRHRRVARWMLAAYNRRGAFDNRTDSVAGLREILEGSFQQVEIETVGSIALFSATRAAPT